MLSVTGTLASTVGQINPFRYRGYYYDTETGFYYLQTRYYDPEVGRFLNADGIIGANGGIIGLNSFAYCSNNPVGFSDPSGEQYVMAEADKHLGRRCSEDYAEMKAAFAAAGIPIAYAIELDIQIVKLRDEHIDIDEYFRINSNVDVNNVDRRLLERLYIMGHEYGISEMRITSGYRSIEKQAVLYKKYQSGGTLAAKPGTSWHNFGGAIDISDGLRFISESECMKFGLIKPVHTENWHFQIIETRGQKATEAGETYIETIVKWGD